MSRQKFVALAAALALMLPVGAWTNNYAVKVANNQWQLIGVAGIFSLAGEGTDAQLPDLSSPNSQTGVAVIDMADTTNNVSWDANTTTSASTDPNAVAATAAANTHFANDATAVAANLATDNTGLGLPYHAVLGVRAINVGTLSTLAKAIVVIGQPVSGKDYQSPMRTMYLVSPYSSGEPDMMVIYQATMEGDTFKISFKDNAAATWDFDTSTTTDTVYTTTFDYTRTYDNPVASSELNLIVAVDGTSGGLTQYGNVVGSGAAFDMNISAHLQLGYTSTAAYDGNRSVLDGNLTMYRYVASSNLWEIMTFEGDGTAESSTYGNNLLTAGFGYWTRLTPSTAAGTYATNYEPGVLARDSVRGSSSFYEGKLSSGWNLMAFDDSTMRYATTGFVIADAAGVVDVISPYGDINVSMATTDVGGCQGFDVNVTTYNRTSAMTGNSNTLDVHCVHTGTASVLISDKPFYIVLNTVADTANVTSLAGAAYAATDLVDIEGNGVADALSSKLGEYALVVERNQDYNTTLAGLGVYATGNYGELKVGVPAWKTGVTPLSLPIGDTVATMSTSFNTFMTGASVGASNAQILEVDLNTSTSNFNQTANAGRAILLASDERFYVREGAYIRLFDLVDQNGSTLNITYGGSHLTSSLHPIYTAAARERDCVEIQTQILAATSNVVSAFCPNQESNTTIMLVSDEQLNFDVKEVNTSTRLLTDVHLGGTTDTNETFYGPFRRVYQASKLATATKTATAAATSMTANLDNLTYSAIWADDFPNNGPLYYLTGNGYKPEMIITAVTSDGDGVTHNTAGTINWKALDATRDPVEWFDPANNFELFWAEKERGYWVYLDTGYTNPVTATNTRVSQSVVNKHFDNAVNSATGEGTVFNWFDGYLTSTVGGLVRTNYTSGQSYNVQAAIGSSTVPLATTGTVSSGSSDFTTYMSDFEVSSMRPTAPIEANVSASDGLGGRATNGIVINYVKPATPVLSMSGNTLTATSNAYATSVFIYDGNISDVDHEPIYSTTTAAGVAAIDMTAVTGLDYPDTVDVNGTGYIPTYPGTLGNIVKDLRVVAATGSADVVSGGIASGSSVYSNMRQQAYVPAYAGTGHLTVSAAVDEGNATEPTLYNVTDANASPLGDFGVQLGYETAGGTNIMTMVFDPKSYALTDGGVTHAMLYVGGVHVATVAYVRTGYQGEPFYLYVVENTVGAVGKWYYGVFPGNNATETWGVSTPTVQGDLFGLELIEISGLVQPL